MKDLFYLTKKFLQENMVACAVDFMLFGLMLVLIGGWASNVGFIMSLLGVFFLSYRMANKYAQYFFLKTDLAMESSLEKKSSFDEPKEINEQRRIYSGWFSVFGFSLLVIGTVIFMVTQLFMSANVKIDELSIRNLNLIIKVIIGIGCLLFGLGFFLCGGVLWNSKKEKAIGRFFSGIFLCLFGGGWLYFYGNDPQNEALISWQNWLICGIVCFVAIMKGINAISDKKNARTAEKNGDTNADP